MKTDLIINEYLTIPHDELEFTASRSGGPGGQHVNKTSSRITLRWNIKASNVLSEELKERLLMTLRSRITHDGDLIIHESTSRSQLHNRTLVADHLRSIIIKGLIVPKKRKKTRMSASQKESRLQEKKQAGDRKKLRKKITSFDS